MAGGSAANAPAPSIARNVVMRPAGVIESVASGSSGAAADLLPHDELFAVHGLRVRSSGEIEHALQESKAGDDIEIVFARNGCVMTRRVPLRDDGASEIRLHVEEEDNALRREWLGRRRHSVRELIR